MSEPTRGLKEELAKVLADPTRENFRELLRVNTGETANLDFKETWPADEKLARHVLALGNSGGGCIVVGVAERRDKTLDPVGLSEFKDKVVVTKKLNPLVPEPLMRHVHIDDFAYDASEYAALQGKKFQLVSVLPDPEHLPFVAEKGNADARSGAVYVRRGTESVEANHAELQRMINARIATGHSTAAAMKLDDHLDQLAVLQGRIPRSFVTPGSSLAALTRLSSAMMGVFGAPKTEANPKYPKEDMEAFVLRMFEAKKMRIARELDVLP